MRKTGQMSVNVSVVIISLLLTTVAFAFSDTQAKKVAILINNTFVQTNYEKKVIDDEFAKSGLNTYLKYLDESKILFLKKDIDNFSKDVTKLDDQFKKGDLSRAFKIFELYEVNVNKMFEYMLTLLGKNSFNWESPELYSTDVKKIDWAETDTVLQERWNKRVKFDLLELKVKGKSTDVAIKELDSAYRKRLKNINKNGRTEAFEMYANAFLHHADPHTTYFTPVSGEEFNQQLSLSLFGVGAVLGEKSDFIEVQEIISGGPLDKNGSIKVGDLLVAVAQGEDGEMVSLSGAEAVDAVKLVKGPKGTVVRLNVEDPTTGKRRVVTLIRDKVDLNDQRAKGEILNDVDGIKIGVIHIPSFYQDFDAARKGEKGASVYQDVEEIIVNLNKAKVEGIVINLMDNGGGSLSDVAKMAGIFIGAGLPAVFTKDSSGDIEAISSDNSKVTYGGPLAVLINNRSASASEIFAGYIKDYKRGIIIGGATYGKGTVQMIIDLDEVAMSEETSEPSGEIKVTIAKFFRVNGMSTQHQGVIPDIIFPTSNYVVEDRESFLENTLPFEKIDTPYEQILAFVATNEFYEPVSEEKLMTVSEKGLGEGKAAKFMSAMVDRQKLVNSFDEKRDINLSESSFKREVEKKNEENLKSLNEVRTAMGISLVNSLEDLRNPKTGKEFIKKLVQTYNEIGANILANYIKANR